MESKSCLAVRNNILIFLVFSDSFQLALKRIQKHLGYKNNSVVDDKECFKYINNQGGIFLEIPVVKYTP